MYPKHFQSKHVRCKSVEHFRPNSCESLTGHTEEYAGSTEVYGVYGMYTECIRGVYGMCTEYMGGIRNVYGGIRFSKYLIARQQFLSKVPFLCNSEYHLLSILRSSTVNSISGVSNSAPFFSFHSFLQHAFTFEERKKHPKFLLGMGWHSNSCRSVPPGARLGSVSCHSFVVFVRRQIVRLWMLQKVSQKVRAGQLDSNAS